MEANMPDQIHGIEDRQEQGSVNYAWSQNLEIRFAVSKLWQY